MRPLEAHEQLIRFGRTRGENSFRLAMHASVPQSFRADLLHLLCLNFVPEASRDVVAETDVLLAEFCEENAGYYRFDPAVRAQLQDLLENEYAGNESRIRMVAAFLSLYTEHCRRVRSENQDTLMRQYLEVQRWVALSYLNPESAAMQLATALRRSVDRTDVAARLRVSGLISTIAQPLARYTDLLVYAKGIEAAQSGDVDLGRELLERFEDSEPEIAGVKFPTMQLVLHQMEREAPEVRAKGEIPRAEAVPIKIFISYSHKDEGFESELRKVLTPLEAENLARVWSDSMLLPNQSWDQAIRRELDEADLILAMVSPDYLAGKYSWEIEASRAMERARAGEARLVPIVLRACAWLESPLRNWQGLPRGVVPVVSHRNRAQVWQEIARDLRDLVASMSLVRVGGPRQRDEISEPSPQAAENGFDLCVVASHKDRTDAERLHTHLAPFIRSGLVRSWSLQEFGPADSISPEALDSAELVVVLMTADLFAANLFRDLARVIKKAGAGEISLLPVVVRSVHWEDTELYKFPAAPRNGRPIDGWANRDKAWVEIAQTIANLGRSLIEKRQTVVKSSLEERTLLTDAENSLIDFTPQKRTIEELISIARPKGADLRVRKRLDAEKKSYRVRALLAACKVADNSDLMLILQGETGVTMRARIPGPDRASTPNAVMGRIREAHEFVIAKIFGGTPRSAWLHMQHQVAVEATGVGHFADFRGQTGIAPNGFELRPVFGILFARTFPKKAASKPVRKKKVEPKPKTRPKMKKK